MMNSKTINSSEFKRLKKGLPDITSVLVDSVVFKVSPILESVGFTTTKCMLENATTPDNEIVFKRSSGDFVDYIHIAVDKLGKPKLQVYFYRRNMQNEKKILRSASLVSNSEQYLYFWGKPWWIPEMLFGKPQIIKCASTLELLIPQVFKFLDTGERGSNIGMEV